MTYSHTITEATTRRVVNLLDNLDVTDPEAAHSIVDELLLDLVPDDGTTADDDPGAPWPMQDALPTEGADK